MKLKLDKQSKTALFIILGYTVLLSVLAYFRFAIYDEKLYLHETAMMSEVLKQGEWIGRYGVGVHGFLFKLPVALVYLITGPSIYVATFFHIILSAVTAWLFYLFTRRFFKDNKWMPIWALLILITNFSYVSWSTTFHREIPVLFATMLFIYFYTKDGKKKLLPNGFLLLLILDAKEYVFFMILPALLVHSFILEYSKNKNLVISILNSLKNSLILIAPPLIYLFLMFYTTLLPINMFNASLLGLTEGGISYQASHISLDKSLVNTYTQTNSNLAYNSFKTIIENSKIFKILFTPFSYIEKFFYISNFSFQYIPLVLLIPSLVSSIYTLLVKKETNLFLFSILFYWSFLVLFLLRASQGRYLFPIIPLYILFFVLFLILQKKDRTKFEPYFKATLFLMAIASVVTLFYQNPANPKELFNIFASLSFTGLFFWLYYLKKHRKIIVKLIVSGVIISSLFITTYALLTKNQLYLSLKWGINGEADKIAELVEPGDIIFIDSSDGSPVSKFTYLIKFYKTNDYLPIEWNWKLDKGKITRELDKREKTSNFFSTKELTDINELKEEVYKNNINKIILLKSKISEEQFPLQNLIDLLKEEDWVKIQRIEPMKNKEIYIFKVML